MKAAFVLLALAMMAPIGALATCTYCAAPTSGIPLQPPTYMPYTCASPRYSTLTKKCSPWGVPVGQCCGQYPYPPCPAISCSAAFSYSSSGPGQCAQSYSVIEAATVSQTALVSLANYTQATLATYCAGSSPYTADLVVSYAAALANAYAEAVATTLIYHSQFVCYDKFQNVAVTPGCGPKYCSTCNGGQAISIVSASVQAVAMAAAEAFAEAIGAIVDVYGNTISYGQADAQAVADAINIAVDTYYNGIGAGKWFTAPGQCASAAPATQCKTAVAQALSCTFTQILVEVYSNTISGNGDDAGQIAGYTPNAASCANSYSVAYSIGDVLQSFSCPNINCPNNIQCDSNVNDCSAYNTGNPQYTSPGGTRKLLL